MSNTLKTLKDGDVLRKALSILHNNLVLVKNINRQYDDRFAVSGAKNGGELQIRNPNQFTVTTGAIMDAQDVTESTQTLTVATQKHVAMNFSSYEYTMSLDDFSERYLEPAMARLAADVDATVIAGLYPYIYNLENTTLGTKPTYADVLAARAMLQQGLAPGSNRFAMTDALATNSIITDCKSLFHQASEIERQFSTGLLGTISNIKFYESEMTPTHTCGTRTDTTPTVSTTVGITSGDATITIDSFASSTTFTAGDVFTIAGVYAVNPETKAVYSHLQKFSVISAVTASATTMTCEVSPTPVTSGAYQNVSIETASATAAVENLDFGAASTAYRHSIVAHRDFATFVSADLEAPSSVPGITRDVYDGIAMRLWRGNDIVNDKFPTRIDVLFGYKAIRPEWAVRMCS